MAGGCSAMIEAAAAFPVRRASMRRVLALSVLLLAVGVAASRGLGSGADCPPEAALASESWAGSAEAMQVMAMFILARVVGWLAPKDSFFGAASQR
mmetsp:Transcript_758/g.1828  ORF Transcript_758/g.1828 Transcript_758/m.1828 type:complete len:96 (-) Transcript_758:251-538(-)